MHEAIVPLVTYLLKQLIWRNEHKFSFTSFGKIKRIQKKKSKYGNGAISVSIFNFGLLSAKENEC